MLSVRYFFVHCYVYIFLYSFIEKIPTQIKKDCLKEVCPVTFYPIKIVTMSCDSVCLPRIGPKRKTLDCCKKIIFNLEMLNKSKR